MPKEMTVKIVKSLDADTADAVLKELNMAIDEGALKVTCDFSSTDYISSIGIGVIMSAFKRLKKSGGELVIGSPKPRVVEVFQTTGLAKLFSL